MNPIPHECGGLFTHCGTLPSALRDPPHFKALQQPPSSCPSGDRLTVSMSRASPTCVYCGRPRGGPEHAFPRWLQRLNNPDNEPILVQLPDGRISPSRGWDYGKIVQICTPCNTWMGQKYESRVAPIVKELNTGQDRSLTRREQHLLASWAYKTALMIECIGATDSRVDPGEMQRFRSSGEPPADCSIVIAAGLHGSLAYHRAISVEDTPQGTSRLYAYILVAGYVIFHVIGDIRSTHAAHHTASLPGTSNRCSRCAAVRTGTEMAAPCSQSSASRGTR